MKLLSFLKPLEERQRDLQAKISATRSAIAEATRALSLCNLLEQTIPEKIEEIRASLHGMPGVYSSLALEDRLGGREEFTAQRQAVAALERLLADIPQIRAHWAKRQKLLTA